MAMYQFEKESTGEALPSVELHAGIIEETVLGYRALQLVGFEDLEYV